jgi:hypothetical protein
VQLSDIAHELIPADLSNLNLTASVKNAITSFLNSSGIALLPSIVLTVAFCAIVI